MPRHTVRSRMIVAPVVAAVALLPAACGGGGGEDQLITNFFRAARLRDNVTLGNISAVTFNPNTQGVVERHTITEIGPEQRRSIDLRELTDAHLQAREQEEEFSRRRQEFQVANSDAINRVTKIRNSGQPLSGRDADMFATLEQWRDEHNEYDRKLSEARSRLERDRARVVNSLTRPGERDIDLTGMELELVTKTVTVDANVRTPEGEITPRTLVFTLQRAVGTRDGDTHEGRWIITDLQ